MPKKQADGVRWQPIGSARPDRVQYAMHNQRAIVLGTAPRRAAASKHRTEEWRPIPGRDHGLSIAERARRAARNTGVSCPAGKAGKRELERRQQLDVERKARKAAKKRAASARHAEVNATMRGVRVRRRQEHPLSVEEAKAADARRSEVDRRRAREKAASAAAAAGHQGRPSAAFGIPAPRTGSATAAAPETQQRPPRRPRPRFNPNRD